MKGTQFRWMTFGLVVLTCAVTPAKAQEQNYYSAPQYAPNENVEGGQPPPFAPSFNQFANNAPAYTGGGYTGYGGNPNYSGSVDYRYHPTESYYQHCPPWANYNPAPYAVQPRYAYAPSGLTIPAVLNTSISTQVASQGDMIQAAISQNVSLQGLSYIPAGSCLVGQVNRSQGGRHFSRSAALTISFNQLRLADGTTIPIQAHIVGDVGKYAQNNGQIRGEGWGTKLGSFAMRAAIGAGSGAVLGTALGAIASRGEYVGTGAWAGTAIGGGIGVLDALVLRKGRDVLIRSGTPINVQLDDAIQIPCADLGKSQV